MEASIATAVEQARAGDDEAFRTLVEHWSRRLFRLAYRMTGNEYDAEEVVQESFFKAYRQLGRFESRAEFGTWLTRIAMNCAVDVLRARARHDKRREPEDIEGVERVRLMPDGGPTPDEAAYGTEIAARVSGALSQLSPMERAAFTLRHFEGQSIREISEALGVSGGATKNSIFRAVAKLRRVLEPLVTGPQA